MQILADLHKERSHRDLKPQNIMVAQSKTGWVAVKLIDFAASRMHDQGKRYFASYSSPDHIAGWHANYVLGSCPFKAYLYPAFPQMAFWFPVLLACNQVKQLETR